MQKSLRFKFKKKNRASLTSKRNLWGWRFLMIFALLIFIVGLVIGNVGLIQRRERINRTLSDLKSQFEDINNELKNNQADNFINNSPAYLERVAREELNLRKPEENVVAFPLKIEEEIDKTEGLLQKIKDKPK